jgi:nitronate monooxygenase
MDAAGPVFPPAARAVAEGLHHLTLPLIAAPMFLVSGPELVIACCRNGIVGSFPALNLRATADYDHWLEQIESGIAAGPLPDAARAAPHAVNLIVHASNPRLAADLEVTVRRRVPLVITSLGAVADVVQAVHSYGGLVFHDVIGARHGEKALAAGVDGLIAVSAGAGGHAGSLSPFALLGELRELAPDKAIVLAGAVSSGRHVAAAIAAGADYAYMGTRMIATRESLASDAYKAMLIASRAADIVYTPKISGIHANFIRQSIVDNGLDLEEIGAHGAIDIGEELNHKSLAWKHIWSAGHGSGQIHDLPSVAELCARLRREYQQALAALRGRTPALA